MDLELEDDEELGFPFRDVLKELGFRYDGQSFIFNFGNCELRGSQILNLRFQQVFAFYGYYVNSRSASFLEFQIPAEVESFEQGVAFLSYHLSNAEFTNKPDWLTDGLAWQSHLPWVRERVEYENLPKALVARDWFKMIVNELLRIAEKSNEDDLVNFSFDGEVLRITCCNQKIIAGASGKAWESAVAVKAKSLSNLPKRIKREGDFIIYVAKKRLHIGNCIYEALEVN